MQEAPWRNVAWLVERWAAIDPDKEALVVPGEMRLSWAELDQRVQSRMAVLADAGVGRGDRVACLMHNRAEYIEFFLAVQGLGAIFVPLNVRLAAPELLYAIRDCGANLVLTHDAFAGVVGRVAAEHDVVWWTVDGELGVPAEVVDSPPVPVARRPIESLADDHVGAILYTSGTTGQPKGAMVTHGNMRSMAEVWKVDLRLGRDQRHLLFLPLCFTGGIMCSVVPPVQAGATMVLLPEFDPAPVLDAIEQYAVTWTIGVPFTFQQLAQHPRFLDADLTTLSRAMIGAAPAPASLIETYEARGVGIVHAFGMTEGTGGANLFLSADRSLERIGSMGRPTSLNEIRLRDPDGDAVSTGEVGEMQFRGPLIFAGYWNNPQASDASFTDDGWLRTGDLARVDKDGYFWTAGRAKDMILSGGLNVYAAEVEAVVGQLDFVGEVAVVGQPDERWGEIVVAHVVPANGAEVTHERLVDACRGQIADYKIPKQVVVQHDPLPRTVSGKLQKHRLLSPT